MDGWMDKLLAVRPDGKRRAFFECGAGSRSIRLIYLAIRSVLVD